MWALLWLVRNVAAVQLPAAFQSLVSPDGPGGNRLAYWRAPVSTPGRVYIRNFSGWRSDFPACGSVNRRLAVVRAVRHIFCLQGFVGFSDV